MTTDQRTPHHQAKPRAGRPAWPLLLFAMLTFWSGTSVLVAQDWSVGPVRGPNGNYYEVVGYDTRTLTWDEAKSEANGRSQRFSFGAAHDSFGYTTYGSLAIITSEEEDLFVEKLRQQALREAGIDPHNPPLHASLWLGGKQSENQRFPWDGWHWLRTTNPIEDYTNWLPNEPNDSPSNAEDHQENYLSIGLVGQFGWNDRSAPTLGYVVEYAIPARQTSYGPIRSPEGHYYEFVRGITFDWSWQEAEFLSGQRHLNQLGGHLATITSATEDNFINYHRQRALQEFGFDLSDLENLPQFWVGGYQSSGESQTDAGWEWLNQEGTIPGNNTSHSYAHWIEGQPNDWPGTGTENNEENGLTIGLRGQAGWNDNGDAIPGFVIEYDWPLPPTERFRSAHYDGNGGIRHAFQNRFNQSVAMSIEAWVQRETSSGWCETILSQGFNNSFWFGFCQNRLQFYRSGGTSAGVEVDVPVGQWTHVAASYNGAYVTFYVNGQSVGRRALDHAGNFSTAPVYIGCNDDYATAGFHGSLDEIRLWSVARNASEIAQTMWTEIQNNSELVAVWEDAAHLGGDENFTFIGSPHTLQRVGMLPQDLVVPLAAVQPKFDGNVNLGTEYVGAEQVIIRYQDGPHFWDAVAYLVHTKDYLYVGIPGARQPASAVISLNNAMSVYVDAEGSTTNIDADMVRGELFIAEGLSGFSEVRQHTIQNPFNGSITTFYDWDTAEPASYLFQARQGTQFLREITTVQDMEYRFHRDLLGNFDASAWDRLAISHVANGGPIGNVWSPHAATPNQPGSWLNVRYLPFPAGTLPEATIRGDVLHADSGRGLGGWTVDLRSSQEVVASTRTASDGSFAFNQQIVPLGQSLSIRVHLTDGTLAYEAISQGDGIEPTYLGTTTAGFPACAGGNCQYSTINFHIRPPIPQTRLLGVEDRRFWPPVLVQAGLPTHGEFGRSTSTPVIQVEMENYHEGLNFYLVGPGCDVNDPMASASCELYENYYPLNLIASPGENSAFCELQIPNFYEEGHPEMRYPAYYRLVAHDTWVRPGNPRNHSANWRYAPEPLWIQYPPYEEVHGFPFVNISDGHDWSDYRSAFYDQVCIPDPIHQLNFWSYFSLYMGLTGNGECLGMVATSQRLARQSSPMGRRIYESLIPSDHSLSRQHRWVLYGNGFEFVPGTGFPQPVLPARFDDGLFGCSPDPLNIWAQIRADHGVQFSTEAIQGFLHQLLNPREGVLLTDMNAAVNRLRTRPLEFMVCFREGEKGHCVQPLRVIDLPTPGMVCVEVYDPNVPNQRKELLINLFTNTYTYTGGFSETWNGQWLFVLETDPLYNNPRHVPPVSDLGSVLSIVSQIGLEELLQFVIFGDAEPLAVSPDGGRVGWEADGSYVETTDLTVPMPVFNWLPEEIPALGHLPLPMYQRLSRGTPEVQIHHRGSQYGLHASHDGSKIQLFVQNGTPGQTDTVQFTQREASVNGLDFRSGQNPPAVEARITLRQDNGSFPAAISLGIENTDALGVRILPGATGVQFLNDGEHAWIPVVQVTLPGPNDIPQTMASPSLPLPGGAALSVQSQDGITFDPLIFEVDENRDGTPEQSLLFNHETGQFTDATPRLRIRKVGTLIEVSWPNLAEFQLMISQNLKQWVTAQGVIVEGNKAYYRWQPASKDPDQFFFQLERLP